MGKLVGAASSLRPTYSHTPHASNFAASSPLSHSPFFQFRFVARAQRGRSAYYMASLASAYHTAPLPSPHPQKRQMRLGMSMTIPNRTNLNVLKKRASCRIRTNDPEITNHVLWPTELKRRVGKLLTSRRYNQLPLLRSRPGGFEGSWPCKTYPSLSGCKGRHFIPYNKALR